MFEIEKEACDLREKRSGRQSIAILKLGAADT